MTQPIGLTVLGGLTFGSMMTLFVMPVIYYIFNSRDERRAAKKARKAQRKAKRLSIKKQRELPEIVKRNYRKTKVATTENVEKELATENPDEQSSEIENSTKESESISDGEVEQTKTEQDEADSVTGTGEEK